ncbi:M20/M25/M40 family metallo-hydrolase [Rubinisphaera sp.]|uniref:M20/M25/M40 family metallo-hydrolase n=1 Tax=Rubinisphaera sp. TaxID=2024857 RepID=UPI000C108A10|nr:M20/M25/M40 family metallo-hydrolase [Rubinisphaera sp.]MBV11069.1 peptidase M20 [Rubinisphaera sp.]HCS50491.1 peptidase M20 [Planctomycetaceae bacterium]
MSDALQSPNVNLLMTLLKVSGKSGQEQAVMLEIESLIKAAGLPAEQIRYDDAHLRAGFGETGNLIVTLPGTVNAPRRLLMAHVDTVPLCVGAIPEIDGEYIISKLKQTALGGDDRSGAAVVLSTLLRILKEQPVHPPLTFLWTIQEEIGLVGARYVDPEELQSPELCFNFDGGDPKSVIRGATGDTHMDIRVYGIASHAGAHPENGVSAIVIVSRAIFQLQEEGWLGLIGKPHGTGTSNIGFIQGGAATNVVTDFVELRAEARSHDPEFRMEIVNAIQQAFIESANTISNVNNEHGSIEFESRNKYDAFALDKSTPVVQSAMNAVTAEGLEVSTRISNGGLDANWMASHGFPTVTLGCGQEFIHTVNERLHIPSYEHTCNIAWRLATEIDS